MRCLKLTLPLDPRKRILRHSPRMPQGSVEDGGMDLLMPNEMGNPSIDDPNRMLFRVLVNELTASRLED